MTAETSFSRTSAFSIVNPPTASPSCRLTGLKEKLIKIGAKVVTHGRYVAFQMAEVAVPRTLFAEILRLIAEMRGTTRSRAGVTDAG